MSSGGRPDVDADRLRYLVRALQVGLVGITVLGLLRYNWSLVINAGVSLAVTVLPAILARDHRVQLGPGLTLWITAAVFLHAVGALGAYQVFGWFDQVTHTLSATIVAGAGYASVRVLDEHDDSLTVPPTFLGVFVVVFVLAFGVLWEILEFGSAGLARVVGGDPVLAQYGVTDIVLDLVFDAVGAVVLAVLVAVLGSDHLGNLVEGLGHSLER